MQHKYDIANQAGAGFRADLNEALRAIVSNNSGPNEPSPAFAFQWWADTTKGLLKQRNAANNAWLSLFDLTTGLPIGVVRQTSATGAIVMPYGETSERPDPIPADGLLMRGNKTTGNPEWYDRTKTVWTQFSSGGVFTAVPATYAGPEILVTQPHLRKMVWGGTKYVRAPWHQVGKLSYFLRQIPLGSVEVRSDVVLKAADFPDLAEYLGVVGTTFVLDEARGEFLRTYDSGRGIDPGRIPGGYQVDTFLRHSHSLAKATSTSGSGIYVAPSGMGGTFQEYVDAIKPEGAGETRGRNITYRLAVTY